MRAHVLDAPDLDHAVARGAAYYGLARRGRGVRIRSGAARTYYVGIESAMPAVPGMPAPLKALCVVPVRHGGRHRARTIRRPRVRAGRRRAGRVPVLSAPPSASRTTVGALIEDWGDDIEELSPRSHAPPRRATGHCRAGALETRVTEVGTLELWCVSARCQAAVEARAQHPRKNREVSSRWPPVI